MLAALKAHPSTTAIVYEGTPVDFNVWGQEGLFPYALDKHGLPVRDAGSPDALETMRLPSALLLTWDAADHKLLTDTYPADGHAISQVDFAQSNPIWQLKDGWKGLSAGCRSIAASARITLREPKDDSDLALRVNPRPGQIVRVSSAGEVIGEYRFTKSGVQTVSSPVSSLQEAVKEFEIAADPPGIPICACGFVNH
ncbi:MAG: hypothetical protein ACR2NN_26490 [Bryobacteraceae bacterium]